MSEQPPSDSGGGRATVTQVYAAVGELRQEVVPKIDSLSDKIDLVVVNHEHRLTEQATSLLASLVRLTKVEDRLDVLSTEHAVAKGHLRAIAMIGGALLTATCGVIGIAIAHAFGW